MLFLDKYRKKQLEKDRSRIATRLIPLHRIHSMGLIIDASSKDWEEGVKVAQSFCIRNKIELHIMAVNLRVNSDPKILTASDVNLLGFPKREKSGEMLGKVFNFLLCICDNRHFCIEYIVKCIDADMKAGLSDHTDTCYDITISTPKEHTDAGGATDIPTKTVFNTVAGILKQIK